MYCLTAPWEHWNPLSPVSVEIHWLRQYLVNFMGLAGTVNATVYNTEQIFTALGQDKLSKFLTLLFVFDEGICLLSQWSSNTIWHHRADSGNGSVSCWVPAITWTNAGLLSIGSSRTNVGDIWIKISKFLFNKMHLKRLLAKCRPFRSTAMCCSKYMIIYLFQNWHVSLNPSYSLYPLLMPCMACHGVRWSQCLPFYIINEVGHLTTSVDHLAEFCQNYHLAAICTQLMVKFFYN